MVAIRQDFLRLLREDAEFKAEVRRAVLTDEVLNMPETLARISVRLDETSKQTAANAKLIAANARQGVENDRRIAENARLIAANVELIAENARRGAENDRRIAENARLIAKNGRQIDRLTAWMEDADGRLKRAGIDIGNLKGDVIELKMANWLVPFISAKMELRAGRIVMGGQATDASIAFDDLLYDAYTSGVIDKRERDRIIVTDMIVSAISRKSGARVYIAVEASYVIDIRDVTRARNSAEILAKAFPDAETYSAVYGRRINPEGQSEADRRGVSIYEATLDESAYPPP